MDSKRLVVVCGAGVSMAATRGDPRANWAGLIAHGLEWCDGYGVELPGRNGLRRAQADLKARDLLSAADKLQRGLVQGGWWAQFLRETFASLKSIDTSVLDAIIELGTPIATTNYDTLLSARSGLPAVSWRSSAATSTLRGSANGVLHLHGVWTEPDSIILSSDSYGSLLATAQTQAIERAMAVGSSMLFIGVGAGIDDPNFGSLSKFMSREFEDAGLLHARLVRRGDRVPAVSPPIRDVTFGDSHEDLVPFLHSLAPRPRARRSRAKRAASRQAQSDEAHHLLTTPLLRGFDADGPVFSEIWPQLVLDRHVRARRAFASPEQRMGDWMNEARPGARVTIVGGPGAGKSTQLMSIAMSQTRLGTRAPRYMRAENLLGKSSIDLSPRLWVLLDGLDELGHADQQRVAEIVGSAPGAWWWFGCRSDFYSRQTPLRDILRDSDEVLELLPLTSDDIDRFLGLFAARSHVSSSAAEQVQRWREDPRFDRLLDVPLNLTLAVYLSGQALSDNLEAPRSRYELYEAFYRYWVGHERKTLKLRRAEVDRLQATHSHLALTLYTSRQSGTAETPAYPKRVNRATGAALSFMITKENELDREVHGFLHDTLMEFILARDLMDEFTSTAGPAPLLATAFNDDVNSFVRDGFAKLTPEARVNLAEALAQRYFEHAESRIREHLLYYLGRLDLPARPPVLAKAFDSEDDFLVRRSAALGAILHDDADIESRFLKLVSEQEELARINRAVQLVYFGDQSGELHAAADRGDWSRTRRALLDRLGRDDRRSIQLRWWDVFTLHSFVETRSEPLSPEEAALVKTSVEVLSGQRLVGARQLAGRLHETAST